MKKVSYMLLALLTLVLGSCSDDFTDWAGLKKNAQEDAITIPGFKATSAGAIDLGNVTEDEVATFQLSTAALPADYELTNVRLELTPEGVDAPTTTEFTTSTTGVVATSDLQSLVEGFYGKAPEARTFDGHVYANATKDGESALIDAGAITLVLTPKAPNISSAYYIVGGPNDWATSATERSIKFNHSSQNVYDDPVFTVTFPMATNDKGEVQDTWFAIGSEEACTAVGNGDWSQLLGTTKGNGNNTLDTEESLAPRSELPDNDDGSFKVLASSGAKYVQVTINMLNYTYTIHPVSYSEYFYEIGNESSWSTSHALYGANGDGNYLGYYYLNGEFKFKPNADDWTGDYEYNGEGKIADNGGSNIPDPGAGFYRISVDLANLTYSLMKVSSISMIGTVRGNWDTDIDMTYNASTGNWEWTGELNAGNVKFRVNHDWTYSWGGKNSATDYDNLTETNGKDLSVAESGTYKVTLSVHHENGACSVKFVKQ